MGLGLRKRSILMAAYGANATLDSRSGNGSSCPKPDLQEADDDVPLLRKECPNRLPGARKGHGAKR